MANGKPTDERKWAWLHDLAALAWRWSKCLVPIISYSRKSWVLFWPFGNQPEHQSIPNADSFEQIVCPDDSIENLRRSIELLDASLPSWVSARACIEWTHDFRSPPDEGVNNANNPSIRIAAIWVRPVGFSANGDHNQSPYDGQEDIELQIAAEELSPPYSQTSHANN